MKDEQLFGRVRTLSHTRQHFDIFNALAEWAVNEAGGKKKVFGTKPGVADYTPLDLQTEFKKATAGNLENLPDIKKLLEGILPGYNEMVASGAKSTLSLLKGEVPQDVQDAIQRSTAFKSLAGGFAGSPMGKALTARDLGRTSLDLIQEGQNSAQRWAGITQNETAPWMITGPQPSQTTMQNNLYKQGVEQEKLNVAAAPDPGAAGVFNLQTALGSMAASFGLSSAMQGIKGGGGAPMSGAGAGGGGGGYQQPQVSPQFQIAPPTYNNLAWNPSTDWSGNSSSYGPYAPQYGGYQWPPRG